MVSWLFDIPPSTPLINTVLNFIHAGTFYLFTYRLLMGLFSLLITWFPFLPGFGQRIHMKLVRPNLQLFALQITIQKSFNHVTIYYHKISKSPSISKDLQNHVYFLQHTTCLDVLSGRLDQNFTCLACQISVFYFILLYIYIYIYYYDKQYS